VKYGRATATRAYNDDRLDKLRHACG